MHGTARRIAFTVVAATLGIAVGTAAEASTAEATWRGYPGTMCTGHQEEIYNADILGNMMPYELPAPQSVHLFCPAPTISSALTTGPINSTVYVYDNTPGSGYEVFCQWTTRVYNSTSGTSGPYLWSTGASTSLQQLSFTSGNAIQRTGIWSTMNLWCQLSAQGQYLADYWVDEP
jgi:hypothetical protein